MTLTTIIKFIRSETLFSKLVKTLLRHSLNSYPIYSVDYSSKQAIKM